NNGVGIRRAASGDDLHFALKDGTKLDVSLRTADTISDVLLAINNASPTKLRAEIGTKGNLKLTDLTTGTTPFSLSALNRSLAVLDLGLDAPVSGNLLNGSTIGTPAGGASLNNAGLGVVIEARISSLIDPVNGAIPRENNTLDAKTREFQSRMDQLD